MRHLDALRPARRTRGIDDIGEVCRPDDRRRQGLPLVSIPTIHPLGQLVQIDDRRSCGRQGASEAALGQHHERPGVGEEEGQPLGRVGGVERHVGSPRPEHGQGRHQPG